MKRWHNAAGRSPSLRRAAVASTALVLAVPALAAAFTGSPAARALGQRMLHAYDSVPAVLAVSTGDVYLCSGGRALTDRPHSGCRAARSTTENDLSMGRVTRRVGTVRAPGLPVWHELELPSGAWIRAASGPCWERKGSSELGGRYVRFDPQERLSIAGRSAGHIILVGRERGFMERDVVDPVTAQTPLFVEHESAPNPRATLTIRQSVLATPAPPMTPTPAC